MEGCRASSERVSFEPPVLSEGPKSLKTTAMSLPIARSTLGHVLCVVFKQPAHVPLADLAVRLGFYVLALLPQRALG
jgi:hypothetical protein